MTTTTAEARAEAERIRIQNITDRFVEAAQRGKFRLVKELLERGEHDIDSVHAGFGFNALHAAVDFAHRNIVKLLLRHGANPNCKDAKFGNAALHHAARNGRLEVIHILVEAGGNKSLRNDEGKKPLHLARELQWKEAATHLEEPPKRPNCVMLQEVEPRMASVAWSAPDDNGVPVDAYELYYRSSKATRPWSTGIDDVTKSKFYVLKNTGDIVWEEPEFEDEDPNEVAVALGDDPTKNPEWMLAKPKSAAVNTIDIFQLKPATTYFFVIRAHNASGWSKYSQATRIVTRDTVADPPGVGFQYFSSRPPLVSKALQELTCPGKSPEIVSSTAKSIFVKWAPPEVTNGGVVYHYALEIRPLVAEEAGEAAEAEREQIQYEEQHVDVVKEGKVDEIEVVDDEEQNLPEGKVQELMGRESKVAAAAVAAAAPTVALAAKLKSRARSMSSISGDSTGTGGGRGSFASGTQGGLLGEKRNLARGWMLVGDTFSEPLAEVKQAFYGASNLRQFELSAGSLYVFRVRGRNKSGWSNFSKVSVVAQTNAAAKLVERGPRHIALEWETPMYTEIEMQELQMRAISTGGADEEGLFFGWRTLSGSIEPEQCTYRIDDLRPARPYSFRIRFRVDGVWEDWKTSAVTDPIATMDDVPEPSTAPELFLRSDSELVFGLREPCCNGLAIDKFELQFAEDPKVNRFGIMQPLIWRSFSKSITFGDNTGVGMHNDDAADEPLAKKNSRGRGKRGSPKGRVRRGRGRRSPSPVDGAQAGAGKVPAVAAAAAGSSSTRSGIAQRARRSRARTASFASGKVVKRVAEVIVGGLAIGTPYTFRVRAHNARGWSSFDKEATVRVFTNALGIPDPPHVVRLEDTFAMIRWKEPRGTDVRGVDRYELQKRKISFESTTIGKPAEWVTVSDRIPECEKGVELQALSCYEFRVRAFTSNAVQEARWSTFSEESKRVLTKRKF